MARERSPDRDKAKKMWLQSGGTMKLKGIAPLFHLVNSGTKMEVSGQVGGGTER